MRFPSNCFKKGFVMKFFSMIGALAFVAILSCNANAGSYGSAGSAYTGSAGSAGSAYTGGESVYVCENCGVAYSYAGSGSYGSAGSSVYTGSAGSTAYTGSAGSSGVSRRQARMNNGQWYVGKYVKENKPVRKTVVATGKVGIVVVKGGVAVVKKVLPPYPKLQACRDCN